MNTYNLKATSINKLMEKWIAANLQPYSVVQSHQSRKRYTKPKLIMMFTEGTNLLEMLFLTLL